MKTKFSPTSNASNRKRAYTAIGLAMLLTFVSVMVYMISSLDEDAILSQDEVDVELNEWHTYYVESESDLPECADDTIGRLYYIESSEKFEACTSNGWITVDIKGADGAPGQDGSDGAPGLDAIYEIEENQILDFCGNSLEARNDSNEYFLIMSSRAFNALNDGQKEKLSKYYKKIIHSDLTTIEKYGGGSARCMLNELF